MAMLLPVARPQYTDGNGAPLVGGSVAFCQPGTGGSVFRKIWADEAETTLLQNPVPLDSSGMTFSGGSQTSVWGSGQYELFVRDADGNLIYSAVLDTPGGLQGGTINGSVQINGDLSVVGHITDTLSLTTPQINAGSGTFSGNVNAAGTVSANLVDANGVVSNGDVDAGNNLNVSGSGTINGNLSVGGTLTTQNENVNGTANIATLNATSGNFGSINTSGLTLNGAALLTARGGYGVTDGSGTLNITFSPAFTGGVSALTANAVSSVPIPVPGDVTCNILSESAGQIFVGDSAGGVGNVGVFWIALGAG